MASALILVNGLPGSGKTTLAVGLAAFMDAQLLSKDAVKEALAAILNEPTTARSLGAIAMEVVWGLALGVAAIGVVESWWYRPRDLLFANAGLRIVGAPSAVEIWCDVTAPLARARYESRNRHPMYDDCRRLVDNWSEWSARAEPLALTPALRVDTSTAVDHAALAGAVRAQL